MNTIAPFLVGLALSVQPAFAYRPFITEDAGVAGLKVYQTEASWDTYRWMDGTIDQVLFLVSPIYGPTEDIELSVEMPYIIRKRTAGETTKGLGDINLVAKFVLAWENYENKDAMFTIKTVAKLGNGRYEDELGRGDTEYALIPVFSKILSTDLTVHAQVGHVWATRRQNPALRDFSLAGLAADYAITEPFHVVAEYDWNQHPESGNASQRIAQVGALYAITKDFIVDATWKKGFGPSTPTRGFGIGVAIQF
jgi:hypothetical protein